MSRIFSKYLHLDTGGQLGPALKDGAPSYLLNKNVTSYMELGIWWQHVATMYFGDDVFSKLDVFLIHYIPVAYHNLLFRGLFKHVFSKKKNGWLQHSIWLRTKIRRVNYR